MLNQSKFSVATETEREDKSYRYTSDDKVKGMKFVNDTFQGYQIKTLVGDYYKYKFEVICPNGKVLDKFYKKINAKKAIFEEVEND